MELALTCVNSREIVHIYQFHILGRLQVPHSYLALAEVVLDRV